MATAPRRSVAKEGNASKARKSWIKISRENGYCLGARFLLTEKEVASLIKTSRWQHYVYGLCTDSSDVFYVGKGVNFRVLEHARDAASGDKSEKSQYIRDIGDRLRYTVFLQCEDDLYARGYEACLIRAFNDVLTNIAPASEAAIEAMFWPIDPLAKSLSQLNWIDRYVKNAEAELKRDMRGIIEKCPAVVGRMDKEAVEWVHSEAA